MHRQDANWCGVDQSQSAHFILYVIQSNKKVACYSVHSQSKHLGAKSKGKL